MAFASTIHPLNQMPVLVPNAPRRDDLKPSAKDKKQQTAPYIPKVDFTTALIEENGMKTGHRALQVVASFLIHVVVISAPILFSLWYTDSINLKSYTQTLLVGPPPPPPPPAPASVVRASAPRRTLFEKGKLLAPISIPQHVAMLKEAPLPASSDLEGVPGGVPGGIPGGQMGGVLGGILGGFVSTKPSPPPPAKSNAPVRVGGRVREPRAIVHNPPAYPSFARGAKIQGDVVIQAILDEHGNVVEMKVVSGPPLLYQAALDAVAQWKYEPSYLNEQPVSVMMNIRVKFELTQ